MIRRWKHSKRAARVASRIVTCAALAAGLTGLVAIAACPACRSGAGAMTALAAPAPSSASAAPAPSETTETPTRRLPDGVAVDPLWEPPPLADSREASATVIALRTPPGDNVPRTLVASFFRAIVNEDAAALGNLFASDATESAAGARGPASPALDPWRARLRHGQYRRLANQIVYQEDDVETYRYDDLEPPAQGRPLRPVEMRRADLFVRVAIHNGRAGSDRLFGDDIALLLRRSGTGWRIRQIIEDFQLP